MKLHGRSIALIFALILTAICAGSAGAALKAVGPIDPITTIPAWYQDTANTALMPCLDQNGFCVLPPEFDPAITVPPQAITTTGPITDANFPAEAFYYSAGVLFPIEAGELARLDFVLEYAFLAGVIPTTGTTFLRTDLQKMRNLAPLATYRVTHPYGSFTFATDGAGNTTGPGGVAVRQEDGTGVAADYMPPLMQAAATTGIGPWLKPASGVLLTALVGGQTHTYLGDGVTPVLVTGSPTGNNFVRIDRLNAAGGVAATWSTNLFTLMGRVWTDPIATPLTVDRAVYSRDAASGHLDVYVRTESTATVTIAGTGLTATNLTQDFPNSGKFFATIPFATLPTGLSITSSLDIPPIPHPVIPGDEILVSEAFYNPASGVITVKADSLDNVAPLPTLSVPAFAAPNTLDATGLMTHSLAANTIPPLNVQVVSSRGGTLTVPLSIFTPPAAPTAVNDAASTAFGAPVTIDVLLNDTSAAGLAFTSTRIIATSPDGTTVVNPNGAVLFTPAAGFSGATSFTYDVADIYGQRSNTATVTVTVSAPPAPTTVADAATTLQATAVTISVLANDTGVMNAASVAISTPSANGTAVANPAGTVTFTPAAGFTGITTFAYTVNNTSVPPLTSAPATVTVTVNAPPTAGAPVANPDSASTVTGTPVTIPVLANDTITAPGVINPASVIITAQSLSGTAVANPDGTVTFSPAAGFTGTTTFGYTVANTSTPPLASNQAIVTVNVNGVAPAPVAVNNTATTTAGTAVTINVLANDTIAAPGVINTASVAIATQSLNGAAVANPTGTITFTPAAGFTGTTTFTYTVANSSTPPLTSNAATVTVTVNAVAAQTIAVSRVQYTLSSGAWRIDGTVTPAPPAGTTLTFYNNATVGVNPLISTIVVGTNGSFTWSSPNNAPAPNAARRISIQSNQNAATKLENISVTVR